MVCSVILAFSSWSLSPARQNIPAHVNKDDAARLLTAATDKKKVLQAQRELAHSRLREAKMQTKLCSWKAKHADHILHIADIHVSRIHWVINRSGHQEMLPIRGPSLERLPVHQDGCEYIPSWIAIGLTSLTYSCFLRGHDQWPVGGCAGLNPDSLSLVSVFSCSVPYCVLYALHYLR
jgi:hypothetical protein